MMDEERYLDLIAQQLSGNISEADRNALFAWVNEQEANKAVYDEFVQLWEITATPESSFEPNVAQAWTNVDDRIGRIETLEDLNNTRAGLTIIRTLLRVAAVFVLALAVGYWIYNNDSAIESPAMAEYQTQEEEFKSFALPDGSTVWLNQNTQLSFAKDFEPRTVFLNGEAFFDVEKKEGQPFEIISGDAKTTVLGTSFNVRAYPQENFIEVTVKTGKVALSKKEVDNPPLVIEPQQSAVFDKHQKKVKIKPAEIDNADAWKTKEIAFDNDPMSTIVHTLERLYGKSFEASNPAILNCPYNDHFKDATLEDILETLKVGLRIDYQIIGDKVILSGDGCK